MARTREGTSNKAAQRDRPTASARRKRVSSSADVDHGVDVPEQPADVPLPQQGLDDVGFPGGPADSSVLRSYGSHVAFRLWDGEDRGELKVVSHGRKVVHIGAPHPAIAGLVELSGLAPLITTSINMADKGLVSTFVERWHAETSSFHLPVGEMTITPDDVSCLLHLSIVGAFYSHERLDITATYFSMNFEDKISKRRGEL